MESCKKTKLVTETEDMLQLLSILAEIHPVLKYERLGLSEGILIFAENRDCVESVLYGLQEMGTAVCGAYRKNERDWPNYSLMVHRLNSNVNENRIRAFLEEDRFTPAVAFYGIIPQFLYGKRNVLVFQQCVVDSRMPKIRKETDACRAFLRQNPDIWYREIKQFRTSMAYKKGHWSGPVFLALELAATVFCTFYREQHDEQETIAKRNYWTSLIEKFEGIAEKHADTDDVSDVVKRVVLAYLDKNSDILIGRINEIEGVLAKAVRGEKAILIDEDWVYFPEKIFRDACQTLLEAVSFPVIKNTLFEAGVLSCNATSGNFTIKKVLTTVYGTSERKRFLKMKKDFFTAYDSLSLEERSVSACTSANSMVSHAEPARIPPINRLV